MNKYTYIHTYILGTFCHENLHNYQHIYFISLLVDLFLDSQQLLASDIYPGCNRYQIPGSVEVIQSFVIVENFVLVDMPISLVSSFLTLVNFSSMDTPHELLTNVLTECNTECVSDPQLFKGTRYC